MKSRDSFRPRAVPAAMLLMLALCLPLCCLAQQNKLVAQQPQAVVIKRGAAADARLTIATIPGFHVNSNTPSLDYLIPLKLTWQSTVLNAKSIKYPQPEMLQLGPDKLSVFTGTFNITTTFIAPQDAPKGTTSLIGQIHYQACNNRMCFRPSTLEVHVPVTIE